MENSEENLYFDSGAKKAPHAVTMETQQSLQEVTNF